MFSSLLRPPSKSRRGSTRERPSYASPYWPVSSFPFRRTSGNEHRHAVTEYGSDDGSQDIAVGDEVFGDVSESNDDSNALNEDSTNDSTPLLPIFSADHLDALPIYNLTHAIRLILISRIDTTLSWDQLRSPQVSQFLLRPMQEEIRSTHFSAATEYALLANCLQFNREISLYPGNSGTSRTRAMACELLAIRLLREHSTRELIDSLCYDFNPLQGQESNGGNGAGPVSSLHVSRPQRKVARISCLEVAIRAQAKRYLAHPLVVQLLEAIWAGSIVFHAAADSMHRQNLSSDHGREFGWFTQATRLTSSGESLNSATPGNRPPAQVTVRRAVTLYNPRDASLFKLSRLRVPRYRNLLSTCSFAVLLGLFLAVLIERSPEITKLEIIFWFWAAGYMLDEIVGFNEQGFGLYIASFWNTFDLGILFILVVHLCLRIYGILMPDARKLAVAKMSYDVLAADAILLFPRLFSILDHYRYFSQLLIAFRMMASDLIAVFVLIVISCSGFFVSLTWSFGNEGIETPSSIAYALLQMILGFSPAAWNRWQDYNMLGRMILTLFLFVCHFLIVTILITVLTNSFMAVVQNANEEHQFVFAVNTLSMVKSDALFSYVAPTNILGWFMTPLRYLLPFRQYLKINRTAIKITHFPILFSIYIYERTFLRAAPLDAVDSMQSRGRRNQNFAHKMPRLAREPSVATFRQDQALEEVFRRPFGSTFNSARPSRERRTSNVVGNWMKNVDEAVPDPLTEQDHNMADRVEPKHRRWASRTSKRSRTFSRSIASDPEEFAGNVVDFSPYAQPASVAIITASKDPAHLFTEDLGGDGDRIASGNDKTEIISGQQTTIQENKHGEDTREPQLSADLFSIPIQQSRKTLQASEPPSSAHENHSAPLASMSKDHGSGAFEQAAFPHIADAHLHKASSTTMVDKPITIPEHGSALLGNQSKAGLSEDPRSNLTTPAPEMEIISTEPTSLDPAHKTKRTGNYGSRLRPKMLPKGSSAFQSSPNLTGLLRNNVRSEDKLLGRSNLEMDLVSDIGDNKAIGGGYVGAIPSSLASQVGRGTGAYRSRAELSEENDMFGRLLMARMNTLEESFREIIHEMRDHMRREHHGRLGRGNGESQAD